MIITKQVSCNIKEQLRKRGFRLRGRKEYRVNKKNQIQYHHIQEKKDGNGWVFDVEKADQV